MRWALVVIVCAGCRFPTPTERLVCSTNDECGDRVCENGFCVVGSPDAATVAVDAPIDTMPDADPFIAIAMQCEAVGYALEAGPNGYYRPVVAGGQAKTWVNAQADCVDDVANATHLIVLSTTEEVTYMDGLLANDAWIGLSDRPPSAEGTFVTVTGETGDQRPFLPGEPNNGGGNEDCIVMRGGGGLDDVPCGNGFRYICECDGLMSTP
jgi:hypothetical protein